MSVIKDTFEKVKNRIREYGFLVRPGKFRHAGIYTEAFTALRIMAQHETILSREEFESVIDLEVRRLKASYQKSL